MKEQPGKRAGLYLRISDDREGLELGVRRQEEDLRAAAARCGDEIVDVYVDDDRGASTRSKKKRPDYARLLRDANVGRITKVWAYTSSRLTRRPMEHEGQIQLAEQHGTEYAYLRSPSFDLNTANGRMIARILAAKDANESEEIGERVARTFKQVAENQGRHGGIRPFGFQADGITHDDIEAAEIAKGIDGILAGASVRGQVVDLNTRGITSSLGKPFSIRTWKAVLIRPRNAGLNVYQGTVIGKAQWKPIVSEASWRAAVVILTDPARNTGGNNLVKWLGSSIYRCGVAGCPGILRVTTATTKDRKVYRCKKANTEKLHGHVIVDRLQLDEYVSDVVIARLSREDAVDLLADPEDGIDVGALHAEGVRLQGELEQLDDDLDNHRIDRARWLRRNDRLKKRIDQVQGQQIAAAAINPLSAIVGAKDVRRRWEKELSLGQQRAILDVLYTVTVRPAPKGGLTDGSYFDEDSVRIEPK